MREFDYSTENFAKKMKGQKRTPLSTGNPVIEQRVLEHSRHKHETALNMAQAVIGIQNISILRNDYRLPCAHSPSEVTWAPLYSTETYESLILSGSRDR
jgi:hypothetical protein